jgi:hypothetical protein
MDATPGSPPLLFGRFQPLSTAEAGGPARVLTGFKSGLIWDFAFSRDGKQAALARGDDTAELVQIRNFHLT